MKRIYVIVPKKINTKPVMKVTAGYAIAQVHHATVLARQRFRLSPYSIVIVLRVRNSKALTETSLRLRDEAISHVVYRDSVSRRNNQRAYTAIVTKVIKQKPKCLSRKKLW